MRFSTSLVHLPDLAPAREQKLFYIQSLEESGLTTKQIAQTLNKEGIFTFTGKIWTAKLVFMNLRKWIKRQQRFNVSLEVDENGWKKR